MITVTNPKVTGFVPRWAPFRGFSILFDSPGDSLVPTGQSQTLTCDVARDPALAFYRTLHDTLARLDTERLTNSYLFCPLPPASYHVTVWDGGNAGNIAAMLPGQRHKLEALLAGFPAALAVPNELTSMAAASPLAGQVTIRFRFDQLLLWKNTVLVARLAAADLASADRLRQLEADRHALSARFRQSYGIAPADQYQPHVSLGYFANQEDAQRAVSRLPNWAMLFAETMTGQVLPFTRASVYGFTDMATFFTVSPFPMLAAE